MHLSTKQIFSNLIDKSETNIHYKLILSFLLPICLSQFPINDNKIDLHKICITLTEFGLFQISSNHSRISFHDDIKSSIVWTENQC